MNKDPFFIENRKVSDNVSRNLHKYMDDVIYYLNEIYSGHNSPMEKESMDKIEAILQNISITVLGKDIKFNRY